MWKQALIYEIVGATVAIGTILSLLWLLGLAR